MKTKILADFQICISVPLRQIECGVQIGPITKNGNNWYFDFNSSVC